MKVFAISDLHLSISGAKPMDIFGQAWDNYLELIEKDWNNKVADEDIVLIAGDISWAMKLEEAQKDFTYFEKLNGIKIITRGNHDYWWHSISKVRDALPNNCFAIQNDAMKFDDVIICGSRGWTVPEGSNQSEEDKKIFDREVMRLEMSLKDAKALQKNNEKIVCMFHYPPFNTKKQTSAFTTLFEKYNVDYVVYGHLHGNNPHAVLEQEINGVKYYLTSCDIVKNKLIRIY